MRTLDVRGVSRRRWYVLVAGLLATAALAAAAFTAVGLTREVQASALLLPPTTSIVDSPDREAPANPFLQLDGLDPALSVLITKMASEEMSDQILADAPHTTYTIDEDPLSQAPIIVVTASGKDAQEAGLVLDRVSKQAPLTLNELQDEAGVRSNARIVLLPLVRDVEITVVWSQILRLEILIIGLGLVGTLLLTGLWDAILRSRAARGELPADGTQTSSIDREPNDDEQKTTDPVPRTHQRVRAGSDRGGWTGRSR